MQLRRHLCTPFVVSLVSASCTTGTDGAAPDAAVSTLAATGLCLDGRCEQIAPGVRSYRPRFELWSDGATKRRWIYLPPGTRIDSSNMDLWSFPVGTKLWKEFTRDGTRVETRLMEKVLASDTAVGAWSFTTFQWSSTQDSAVAVTEGVRDDAQAGEGANCERNRPRHSVA